MKLGMEVPKTEIKNIVSKHDIDNDGAISYKEFKKIFAVEGLTHIDDAVAVLQEENNSKRI
jgi:Ca2+-binding EF-hand superfamily protein